jgi:hypothetical protein
LFNNQCLLSAAAAICAPEHLDVCYYGAIRQDGVDALHGLSQQQHRQQQEAAVHGVNT